MVESQLSVEEKASKLEVDVGNILDVSSKMS